MVTTTALIVFALVFVLYFVYEERQHNKRKAESKEVNDKLDGRLSSSPKNPPDPSENKCASELLLDLEQDDYIDFVLRLIEEMEPAARVMVVVAYANLNVHFLGCSESAEINNRLPKTIEDYIRWVDLDNKKFKISEPPSEIAEIRCNWFLYAALVNRLDNINDDRIDEIRSLLINSAEYLQPLLSNNKLWDEDEKAYFKIGEEYFTGDSAESCVNVVLASARGVFPAAFWGNNDEPPAPKS